MVQFQKPRKFIMGLHPRFHIPAVIESLGGSLVTPSPQYFHDGMQADGEVFFFLFFFLIPFFVIRFFFFFF
jgi:hypothetical protein